MHVVDLPGGLHFGLSTIHDLVCDVHGQPDRGFAIGRAAGISAKDCGGINALIAHTVILLGSELPVFSFTVSSQHL